jgi:hypothetical protein
MAQRLNQCREVEKTLVETASARLLRVYIDYAVASLILGSDGKILTESPLSYKDDSIVD